jgi:hypothetical protein
LDGSSSSGLATFLIVAAVYLSRPFL